MNEKEVDEEKIEFNAGKIEVCDSASASRFSMSVQHGLGFRI